MEVYSYFISQTTEPSFYSPCSRRNVRLMTFASLFFAQTNGRLTRTELDRSRRTMLRHPALLLCALLAVASWALSPAKATEEYALDGATVKVKKTDGYGTFWWFTDMHVDIWGNMKEKPVCAWTPSEQMQSGLNAMKALNGEPDFILMSGDIVHFPYRNNSDLTKEIILATIEDVSRWIMQTFPNTKMYSTLGNHDLSPSNNWPTSPGETQWLYEELARIWEPWLPESALATLGKTGWYSADVDGVAGLRIIAPNTNYWAYYNTYLTFNRTVADVQWTWLENELAAAKAAGKKVYINGHHPPVGQFEGNAADDLWPIYTQRYVTLMEQYSDVVVAGFFGHEHVDEFRLLRRCNYFLSPSNTSTVNSCNGAPFSAVYVGQCMSNCGSPSFREWTFDSSSLGLHDYKSYVYDRDIAEKNTDGHAHEASDYASEWPLQYQWSAAYPDMKDMSAPEWQKQIDKFSSNSTAFDDFMKLRDPTKTDCNGVCKSWLLCNAAYGTYAEFLRCAFNGYSAYRADQLKLGVEEGPVNGDGQLGDFQKTTVGLASIPAMKIDESGQVIPPSEEGW